MEGDVKWRRIDFAATDGTDVLLGLWVNKWVNKIAVGRVWETYIGHLSDDGTAQSPDGDVLPWEWVDFEAWCPLPAPPEGEV